MKGSRANVHGATVSAPPELFEVSESPTPAGVVAKGRSNRKKSGGAAATARLAAALRFVVGLAVVVGTSAAVAWSVHRYAMTTPRFGIRKVELSGNERLLRAELLEQAGVELGKNVFSFDTRAAEAALVKNPWVSSAKVTRELPDGLTIEIVERRAVALVVLGERLFLSTREGEPFKPLSSGDPTDLPVVTGITTSELARDRAGALERIRTAVNVLAKYQGMALAKVHPAQELHLEPSGHAVLTVGKQGITLALGLPPYARKLAMAADVLAELRRKSRTPGIVFLDNEAHPERVVVRMK